MEVPKLWIAGRYQSAQHLGCMGWSVYLSSFYILSVHHFLGTYGVNTLYLFHTMSASTTHFGIEENSINVASMADFWTGEWTKDYLIQVQLPHQKKNPKE